MCRRFSEIFDVPARLRWVESRGSSGRSRSPEVETTRWLWWASHLAYLERAELLESLQGEDDAPEGGRWQLLECWDSRLRKGILEQVLEPGEADTQGYLLASPDRRQYLVVFRGSEPEGLEDWLTDLNFPTTPFEYRIGSHRSTRGELRIDTQRAPGEVHTGFLEALNHSVEVYYPDPDRPQGWSQREHPIPLAVRLQELPQEGRTIWLTGHSLGGALAVLAGAMLLDFGHGSRVGGIHTFGQPKVGDKQFTLAFGGGCRGGTGHCLPLQRWVNPNDPVPEVPVDRVHRGWRWAFGLSSWLIWTVAALSPQVDPRALRRFRASVLGFLQDLLVWSRGDSPPCYEHLGKVHRFGPLPDRGRRALPTPAGTSVSMRAEPGLYDTLRPLSRFSVLGLLEHFRIAYRDQILLAEWTWSKLDDRP